MSPQGAMGDVSRIHRVEPATPLGDHLRVAQSGDRPDGQERRKPNEEPEDQVELHADESETEVQSADFQPPEADDQDSREPRLSLDIAV